MVVWIVISGLKYQVFRHSRWALAKLNTFTTTFVFLFLFYLMLPGKTQIFHMASKWGALWAHEMLLLYGNHRCRRRHCRCFFFNIYLWNLFSEQFSVYLVGFCVLCVRYRTIIDWNETCNMVCLVDILRIYTFIIRWLGFELEILFG